MGEQSPPKHRLSLKLNQSVDKTNTHADKRDNDKTKNQRIRGNRADIACNPSNSRSYKRCHVTEQLSESITSFALKTAPLS